MRTRGFVATMCLVMVLALVLCAPVTALAETPGTVEGVTPRGTTINLFDYWLTSQEDQDGQNPDNWQNAGINSGHNLHFGKNMRASGETIPANQNNVNGLTGIVSSVLGPDGYPILNGTHTGGSTESLAYLFDPTLDTQYRQVYTNVQNLLQVDDEGYYYYNCLENFAYFNGKTNSFELYAAPGVTQVTDPSITGQFFPFNSAEGVFGEEGFDSYDASHYFGMTMSTRFIQQYGGRTAEEGGSDVTYNFSGDDDVWVFIDGKLVGDLGGIHRALSLQINFRSGEVITYFDTDGDNVYDAGEDQLIGAASLGTLLGYETSTLPDNTYHTLDFFYLERGNADSNMVLKYNLVSIPESVIIKIDQGGNSLPGVIFDMYPANSSYEYQTDDPNAVHGTTDDEGEFVFKHNVQVGEEGSPLTLVEPGDISRYWVLVESATLEGYRSTGEIHLRFAYGDAQRGTGPLLVSNPWETGAYSQSHVTVQADSTVVSADGDKEIDLDNGGTMFAVVMKHVDTDGDSEYDEWRAVSGNAFDGWTVGTDDTADTILKAAKANEYVFEPGTNGAYEVTIEDLPGDITSYHYMLENYGQDADAEETAAYTVAYFYTSADSLDSADANAIVPIDPDDGRGFNRIFSVALSIPNIKNTLALEKTDVDGNPVAFVTFSLYDSDDSELIENFTTDSTGRVNITTTDGILAKGSYVLRETSAPENYILNKTEILIVVDDEGVHVDAGSAGDGVTVETGLGTLVYSMKGFAANDEVDATLHDVSAQPQQTREYTTEAEWEDVKDAEALHLRYVNDNTTNLDYSPRLSGDASTYTADEGWSRLEVRQCLEHDEDDAVKQSVDESLNALFTGDVTIHVTNEKQGTLLVSKNVVDAPSSDAGKAFEFEFAIDLTGVSADAAQAYDAQIFNADGTTDSDSFKVGVAGVEGVQTSFSLKDGQTLRVTGLPDNAGFTITEAENSNYTATNTVNDAPSANGLVASGTIDADVLTRVAFTNTYQQPSEPDPGNPDNPPVQPGDSDPSDPSKPDLSVTKTLTGRDMIAGEFSFEIEATGSNASKVTPSSLTGTNDASGNVSFSGEGFVFEEAGEYEFTLSEILPADDDPDTEGVQHNGVTYDGSTHTITAKVTKGLNNKLEVTWDLGALASGVTFANAYEPSETAQIVFGATKVLNGRDLAAGEFTFELRDQDGNLVATATNAADGSVVFSDPVEFTEAGTYTFTIAEVRGDLANVTYDGSTHTATVTVTDNGDGTLTATVSYDGTGEFPTFVNTYAEPEEPGTPDEPGSPDQPGTPEEPGTPGQPGDPGIPDTGDHTSAILPTVLCLGGAALVAGAFAIRWRRSR